MRKPGFYAHAELLAEEEQERRDLAEVLERFRFNPTATPTWDDLVLIEPRLRTLEQKIERVLETHKSWNSEEFEALQDWAWYGPDGIKERLCGLVGWNAPSWSPAVLRGMSAYDVVYDHLIDLLCGEGEP